MEPTCKNLYWLGLPAACCAFVAGCTDPGPLDDEQPRTPFTHYNELRGDDPPLNVETPLGDTHPNIRERWLDQK